LISPGSLPAPAPDQLVFVERARLGIQFTERMSGYLVEVPTDLSDDPSGASWPTADRERSNEWRIECTLTVLSEDLERLLMDPDHEARLLGTVTVNASGFPRTPMTVTGGHFHLFRVDPDRVETRRLEYEMEFAGGGSSYRLRGFKEVRNALPWKAWAALSTCFISLSGPTESGRYYWGVLTLSVADFVRQLGTTRVRHAQRLAERVDGTVGFLGFFARRVLRSYGRAIAPSVIATPDPPRAPIRSVKVKVSKTIRVMTSDNVPVRLTSYNQGPGRPPVILVPGFTTTASSFATPTVDRNLVE
jgi:cholesterol oxidase